MYCWSVHTGMHVKFPVKAHIKGTVLKTHFYNLDILLLKVKFLYSRVRGARFERILQHMYFLRF